MFTTMFWFCVVGLVLSFVGLITTKRVSELIAPKSESPLAIPRTIFSMFWFVGGQFICLILMLTFGLILALMT